MKTVLMTAATWVGLVGAFVLTADTVPWHISLPIVGSLWVGVPVVVAGAPHRSAMGAAAFSTFAAITAGFLALMWISLSLMAGIGNLLFDLGGSPARAAAYLTTAGLLGMVGALLGGLAGARLADRAGPLRD